MLETDFSWTRFIANGPHSSESPPHTKPQTVALRAPSYVGEDWVTERTSNWTRWLGGFAGLPLVRGLEIGSFEGRSALWFMQNVLTDSTSRLLCIDPWNYVDEQVQAELATDIPAQYDMEAVFHRFRANTEHYVTSGRLHYLRGTSRSEMHRLPVVPLFDFIYIDGSHLASSTLEDTLLCWWRLRPGGVMIWDDYQWKWDLRRRKRYLARPKIAVDAFLKIYDERYDLLPGRGWQVAIRRR